MRSCRTVILTVLVVGLVSDVALAQVEASWDFEEKTPGTPLASQERLADFSDNARDAFADGGAARPAVVPGSAFFGKSAALSFTELNDDSAVFRDGFDFGDGGPLAGPDINFLQDDSFTLEALIRVDSSWNGVGMIVGKDVAPNQPSWWFRVSGEAGGVLVAIVADSITPDSAGFVTGTVSVADGDWHHVAFVRDAGADELRLYVDYELDVARADGTLGDHANSNDIRLGAQNNGDRQLQGEVDFVLISRGALMPSEFVQPVIFADDFESGVTSAWAHTSP